MRTAALLVALIMAAAAFGQTVPDSVYQVEITATASPMVNFFRTPRVPGTPSSTCLGYGGSVRVLWHPGRLLGVGLLSGYFDIAHDAIDASAQVRYEATLRAVPMQLALSLQKFGFELGMGIGPYLMLTSINGGGGEPVKGTRLELGMTFFCSYGFPLGDNLTLGPEVRILSFRYRGIISVMPSLSLRFTPLRY